jgi:hypothetical protein
MNDYSELQELSEKATPGPWGYDGSYVCPARVEGGTTYVESWRSVADCHQAENTKFIAAANPAVVLELIAENKGLAKKIKWDESWYGARFETLFHWAHRELNEEQKTQYFNIVANGSSSPLDPPTYAQQMNSLKWKVEAAEKERDMLKAELEALRQDAERYRWLRTQCIPLQGHDFLSSHEILDRRVDAKILKESGEVE